MATNLILKDARYLTVAVLAGVTSGDPVVHGEIPGVALIDRDSDGEAVIDTDGVYDLSVKGVDNSGNKAIAKGDIIYKDGAELNVDATNGTRFGYALEAVASGATSTIQVKIGY